MAEESRWDFWALQTPLAGAALTLTFPLLSKRRLQANLSSNSGLFIRGKLLWAKYNALERSLQLMWLVGRSPPWRDLTGQPWSPVQPMTCHDAAPHPWEGVGREALGSPLPRRKKKKRKNPNYLQMPNLEPREEVLRWCLLPGMLRTETGCSWNCPERLYGKVHVGEAGGTGVCGHAVALMVFWWCSPNWKKKF